MAKIPMVLVLAMGTMPAPIHSAANSGTEAFEKLKLLAGHWESVNGGEMKATLDIELTGGGSAVAEQFHMVDHGKSEDMLTAYYLDGDQVKLTHYCMAGADGGCWKRLSAGRWAKARSPRGNTCAT
jgi:hypothetical protein